MAGQSFVEWSGGNQSVVPTTPATSPTPSVRGQSFREWSGGTQLPSSKPMVFKVGEGLNPAQQSVAQDVLSKEVIPVGVNAPINPEDINIKVPFTGDKYLSVKSPFSEPIVHDGKIKFNEPNIFSGKTDNKFGITKEQLLKDASNAATTVTNFVANLPSDILQSIPRALLTVYKEGKFFGGEGTDQLTPFEQSLYGGEEYVNVNKDISNRIKNGDGILSAYLGGISQKVLDVAFGADTFARGATTLSKALEVPNVYSKIEAWKSLGSPKDAAEAKSNYIKLAQQLHPDKVGGSDIAFQNLQKAKSLLGENFNEIPSIKDSFKTKASKYLEWVGRQTRLTDPILSPNLKMKSEDVAPVDLNLPQIPQELPQAPLETPTPTPEGIPTAPTTAEALASAEAKVAAAPVVEATQAGLKTAPSPFAKTLEKTAIDAGITKGFGEVAGYTPSTIEEQSRLTKEVFDTGDNEILDILKGNKSLPQGLKGGPFVIGVEEYLKINPNEEIAYALANSPLASGVSESASELGLMQQRNPDSAVAKITEIKKAREAKVGKVKTEKVRKAVSKLTEATKKVNLDKVDLDWDNFLEEITC